MNEYTQFHPLFTDHGVENLGLGPWRACHVNYLQELPAISGVYLYVTNSYYAAEHEEILYVGIAPETFPDRWREPEAPGRGGHHVVWRLGATDAVEHCDVMPEETGVVYCELPGCPLAELERIENCLIDLLAPPLNRQKSPLRPFKAAVKYITQFASERGWPAHEDHWPNAGVRELYSDILKQAVEFRVKQIEQASKLMGVVAGHWNYRAFVPGFDFLPREWQRSMRDCPTDVIRKSVLKKLASLCVGEGAELACR